MAAQQAPPSLGFSRQEHWSGVPFPSPMHESESEVAQSCPTLSTPWNAAHQAPPSMGFSRQEYWSGVPLPSPSSCTYWTLYHRLSNCGHMGLVAPRHVGSQRHAKECSNCCTIALISHASKAVLKILQLLGFNST